MSKLYRPEHRKLGYLFDRAFVYPFDGQSVIRSRHRLHTDSLTEPGRTVSIIVTLDSGTHASGWWRNSDYDRCLHLSVTHPGSIVIGRLETPSDKEVASWAKALFGPHLNKTWTEPAASVFDPHRQPNVCHVRLFLDKENRPIMPEGEVYHLKPWKDGTSPEKIFRRTTKS